MEIIFRARQEGKTFDLIKKSYVGGFTIVCPDRNNCNRILQQASIMGLTIPQPITFVDFLERKFLSQRIKGFLIDDSEKIFQYVAAHIPVLAITITKE